MRATPAFGLFYTKENELLENIVMVALALGCGCWFLITASILFNIRTIPRLDALHAPAPDTWPTLAVIAPACNEEESIASTMRLRLQETYPNIAFVVIDDRSTDATGVIADEVAKDDPRFLVIHNRSLPEGWLGKVHALQKGVETTDSEWILFTDVDVHIEPGVLERVIAWCEHRRLDHVTLAPRLEADRFLVKIVNTFFLRMAVSIPAARYVIESPKTRIAAGAGAFNLFRRSALARTPGLERLRLEVIDDTGLAFLLKAHGARTSIINGSSAVYLRWYSSIAAMQTGFEKNGFAIAGYRMSVMTVICAFVIGFELLPFFALLQTGNPTVQLMGGLAIISVIGATAASCRAFRLPAAPAVFYPVGALLMSYFLFRSGVLAIWRKGIVWRGTLYPLKMLRGFERILK